jgi:hypothetical protein
MASVAAVRESERQNLGEEMGVAATEVGQRAGRGRRVGFPEPFDPESVLAEKWVNALEIASTGECGGIRGGKGVEDFWGKAAGVHVETSRRAP